MTTPSTSSFRKPVMREELGFIRDRVSEIIQLVDEVESSITRLEPLVRSAAEEALHKSRGRGEKASESPSPSAFSSRRFCDGHITYTPFDICNSIREKATGMLTPNFHYAPPSIKDESCRLLITTCDLQKKVHDIPESCRFGSEAADTKLPVVKESKDALIIQLLEMSEQMLYLIISDDEHPSSSTIEELNEFAYALQDDVRIINAVAIPCCVLLSQIGALELKLCCSAEAAYTELPVVKESKDALITQLQAMSEKILKLIKAVARSCSLTQEKIITSEELRTFSCALRDSVFIIDAVVMSSPDESKRLGDINALLKQPIYHGEGFSQLRQYIICSLREVRNIVQSSGCVPPSVAEIVIKEGEGASQTTAYSEDGSSITSTCWPYYKSIDLRGLKKPEDIGDFSPLCEYVSKSIRQQFQIYLFSGFDASLDCAEIQQIKKFIIDHDLTDIASISQRVRTLEEQVEQLESSVEECSKIAMTLNTTVVGEGAPSTVLHEWLKLAVEFVGQFQGVPATVRGKEAGLFQREKSIRGGIEQIDVWLEKIRLYLQPKALNQHSPIKVSLLFEQALHLYTIGRSLRLVIAKYQPEVLEPKKTGIAQTAIR